jgi:hypothetical protein
MSVGGSFSPSGGPIDNQQRLQTSPNPSLPPADYSMGYARNFQPPSFFNPFSGYYGANIGMGGFQPQFGGFGGFGGFQQPFAGGFGGQFNQSTREYTQPYTPQQGMPQFSNRSADLVMPQSSEKPFEIQKPNMPNPQPQSSSQPQQFTFDYGNRNRFNSNQYQVQPQPIQMSPYYGNAPTFPMYGGNQSPSIMPMPQDRVGNFNPMMGGIGAFGNRGFMGYR